MFACLYAPPRGLAFRSNDGVPCAKLVTNELVRLAREQSPKVEVHGDNLVVLDTTGITDRVGNSRELGATLRRVAADRRLCLRIAVASTRSAALLVVQARSGLTVVEPGQEAAVLASLPLDVLRTLARRQARGVTGPARRRVPVAGAGLAIPAFALLSTVRRWGVRTLGDLAHQSSATLLERLGPGGLALQRFARGEDDASWAASADQRVESTLRLETPVEGLDPLSFVLSRVFETLCARLAQASAGASVVQVQLKLVTGEIHASRVTLAAPTRDSKALRTLVRLELDLNPPRARVSEVTVVVDPAPTGDRQISLLARAQPDSARVTTLMFRLSRLVGERRCGSPALVASGDGAGFDMRAFSPGPHAEGAERRTGG
jgi:nucleotidyltransferase/DNA polymerase involved in DNA repair